MAEGRVLLFLQRVGYLMRGTAIGKFVKGFNRIIFDCDIPNSVYLPKSTVMPHSGLGVVMHPKTVIGENCTIFHNTTFGSSHNGKEQDVAPIVGENCKVFAGAILIGKIHVGDNAIVAAGAVVLKDVPAGAIVAGVPAKIVGYRKESREEIL